MCFRKEARKVGWLHCTRKFRNMSAFSLYSAVEGVVDICVGTSTVSVVQSGGVAI